MSRRLSVPVEADVASYRGAVADVDDAVAEAALVEELELGARVGRQRRLAPTEDDGPDEQVELVNEPRVDRLCRKVRTSHDEIASGRGLQVVYRAGSDRSAKAASVSHTAIVSYIRRP